MDKVGTETTLSEIVAGLREDYQTVRTWSGSALVANELSKTETREGLTQLYSDLCALGNSLDYYADRLEALSRDTESRWRDITTAPKDGGYFLAAWVRDDGSDPVYGVVWWDNGDWHEYDSSIVVSDPTHWKQITPPEAT